MKRMLTLILLLGVCLCVRALSVVTLRNGQVVRGDVVVHNEEVLIIKNNEGARFQYPASEVVSVEEVEEEVVPQEQEQVVERKVSFILSLIGGGTIIPQEGGGGHIGGELMVGSRQIAERSVFIGGGLGVHGLFANGKGYTFLPLQAALKIPFIEGKHAPYLGAAIGYGFGVSKNCKGGIFTGGEVGYRYSIKKNAALYLSARVQFQQAQITAQETITDEDGTESVFVNQAGRSFVTVGVSAAISF